MASRHGARRTHQEKSTQPLTFGELGLSPTALAAVADMGYDAPTPVQAQAIPLVLSGRDVMAAAQTGTGKTAAFLLPCLDRLPHAPSGSGPLMLVVTPTRELAQQIEEVASAICRHTGHRATTVVGGVGYEPQYRALRQGCDLLVATPGRLVDLIEQGEAHLGLVRVAVLDEADRMLDMGFLPQMRRIVGQLPTSRQTLLFSATLDDHVLDNTRDLVRDPARVTIAHKGAAAETIDQFALPVSPEAKNALLTEVLTREGAERVIVFCRAKHRADAVCRRLRRAGVKCAPIHGNRSQNQRERALAGFRDGQVNVLVATDVLARGIDIENVAYVVNFDVPSDPEDYIHRIGRTGRAGEAGWALTFVTHDDYLDLRDIEALMGRIVPTWPEAQAFDLGEEPPILDPARSPKDKLPGKKERKRMKEERAAEREAAREGVAEAQGGAARDGRKRQTRRRGGAASGPATNQGAGVRGSGRDANGEGSAGTSDGRVRRRPGDRGGAAGRDGGPNRGRDADTRRGGAKKRGAKGSQSVTPQSAVDMSGAGMTWGVRQKKTDGRRKIELESLKAELSDWREEQPRESATRAPEPKRNWREIAAEIAGMTATAPVEEAPTKERPQASPKKRQRRRRRRGSDS